MEKEKALGIVKLLSKNYKSGFIALNFKNPFELLVATILSAQCTDERVNKVTSNLFKKYKTSEDFSKASLSIIEQLIKPTGFYRNKAKSITEASKKIQKDFSGRVPGTMEELITLSGVGRKTANIILTFGFNRTQGIAVDTHVSRIARRLELTRDTNPDKIEKDLLEFFPEEYWPRINSLLVQHGREICKAKKPLCSQCSLKDLCPSFGKF